MAFFEVFLGDCARRYYFSKIEGENLYYRQFCGREKLIFQAVSGRKISL
jgi:hypothetical protein